jgi:hypothetical protein
LNFTLRRYGLNLSPLSSSEELNFELRLGSTRLLVFLRLRNFSLSSVSEEELSSKKRGSDHGFTDSGEASSGPSTAKNFKYILKKSTEENSDSHWMSIKNLKKRGGISPCPLFQRKNYLQDELTSSS